MKDSHVKLISNHLVTTERIVLCELYIITE